MTMNADGPMKCTECEGQAFTEQGGVLTCDKCGAKVKKDGCGRKPKMDSVERIDAMTTIGPEAEQRDLDWGFIEKMTEDADGFLKGRAPVTNIGVFSYRLPDGSQRRELRLPEEVFSKDAMDSLRMAPVTVGHPSQGVKPDTYKELAVGSVGDNLRTDNFRVSAPIVINRKDGIEAVKAGKRGLSCGYKCNVEPSSGVWMGVPYDAIQRNIRYNHVALVDTSRAGDSARLRMDGAGELVTAEEPGREDAAVTQTLGTIRPEFMAQLRADMAVNQPRDKEGKFASTGSSGGGASLKDIYGAPISAKQAEKNVSGVLQGLGNGYASASHIAFKAGMTSRSAETTLEKMVSEGKAEHHPGYLRPGATKQYRRTTNAPMKPTSLSGPASPASYSPSAARKQAQRQAKKFGDTPAGLAALNRAANML